MTLKHITIPQTTPEGEPKVDLVISYARTEFLYEHSRGFEVLVPHPKTGIVSTVFIPHIAYQIDDMCQRSRGANRTAARAVKAVLTRGLNIQTELMNIPRNGFFRFPNDPTIYTKLDYCQGEYEVISVDDYKIIQQRGGVVMVEIVFREELATLHK
jgi:hypothetical protein